MSKYAEIKSYAKRPIDDSDIAFVTENCHRFTVRELAVEMKRTRKTVYGLLKKLGLRARNLNNERVDFAKAQKLIPKQLRVAMPRPGSVNKFPLTDEQQQFILQSHTELTQSEMATHLEVDRYAIQKFMGERSLESLSQSLKRQKRFEHTNGIFNYNLPHDTTWLV